MIAYIGRITIALCISFAITFCGVNGNDGILQAFFTVLGIMYSLSMSTIVGFSLENIFNKTYRIKFRNLLCRHRNNITIDSGVSTLIFIVATSLTFNLKFEFVGNVWNFDLLLDNLSLCTMSSTIVFIVYNFMSLQKLKDDILEKIFEERTNKHK